MATPLEIERARKQKALGIVPYAGKEPFLFVSYAHKDFDHVLPVIKALIDRGFRVWYDEGIDPGTEWDENIADHVERCYCMVSFLSANYLDSDNCLDELCYARDLEQKQLFVYLEKVKLPGRLALRFNRLQAIHQYTYPQIEDFHNQLFAATVLQPTLAEKPQKKAQASRPKPEKKVHQIEIPVPSTGPLLPLDRLQNYEISNQDPTNEIEEGTQLLKQALSDCHLNAEIVKAVKGPRVTRYDIVPEKSTTIAKLTRNASAIALAMGVPSVRIAPMAGTSAIGIEVPHKDSTLVPLKQMLESEAFRNAPSPAAFCLGRDIDGSAIVADISRLPHLLMAGSASSGISVSLHALIVSLLYKATAEELKLILIDSKRTELSVYNELPNLLIPVVTDIKQAVATLEWAAKEMMRRYSLMSDAGVRDLTAFNKVSGPKLPRLVVILDELEDLMFDTKNEAEESICRIAQMGRAAGIHLIIATQHPSPDIITGLIKANIPSRICFSVPSATESRVILDNGGAEHLLGKGDMLYYPVGCVQPLRLQGCFISDSEIESVVDFIKNRGNDILTNIENRAKELAAPKNKRFTQHLAKLIPEAVETALELQGISISFLQRKFSLTQIQASKLMDKLEEMGVVGPSMGNRPRTILMTREQWLAIKKQYE